MIAALVIQRLCLLQDDGAVGGIVVGYLLTGGTYESGEGGVGHLDILHQLHQRLVFIAYGISLHGDGQTVVLRAVDDILGDEHQFAFGN